MPVCVDCPNCRTEYTLVDSLRGKFVRCERCHQSFQAHPAKRPQKPEPVPPNDLPPFQVLPPATGRLPRTILNTGDHPVKDVEPAPQTRSTTGSGTSGAGWPIGLVLVAFVMIRACSSISNLSSHNPSYREPPRGQFNFREQVDFRAFKDEGVIPVPKDGLGDRKHEFAPPWFPGQDKDEPQDDR
jgi:predicted Zn finger-like uncharacterized protein